MDTRQLELLSVNYLIIDFTKTGYLNPYINVSDTEPSWDGFIYVINKKNSYVKSKLGKVPVQIKGKYNIFLESKEISYPVNIRDLENYLYDGGVIYFVVYVSDNDHSIYYVQLEPVKIKEILSNISESQITKNIVLKKLPKMEIDIVNIFKSFLYNKQKQMSFIDGDLYTIDDFTKNSDKVEFIFTLSGLGLCEDNLQTYIELNNVYMYAKIPESPILIPVSGNITKMIMVEDTDLNIGINGKVFYDNQIRERERETVKLSFGDSFEFIIDKKNEKYTFNYKMSDFVRCALKDIEFLIELHKNKGFEVNEFFLDVSSAIDNANDFEIEEYQNLIKRNKKIVELLDFLNIQGDLDCSKLSRTEWRDIEVLIKGIIDKKEVELKENLPCIVTLPIQNYNIPIYITKLGNGKCVIEDIFKVKDNVLYYSNHGEEKRYSVPIFRFMNPDQLVKCSTLRCDILLSEYQRLNSEDNNILSDANYFLLNCIKAADLCEFDPDKRKDFLELSLNIVNWLEVESIKYNGTSDDITQLNKLQIIKRQRKLTTSESDWLFEITESNIADDTLKFGASILLNEKNRAERIFSKFSVKQREEYQEYPIYFLFNKIKEVNS